LSVREGGDIDLGMLDQEAFARVIASGQQQQQQQQVNDGINTQPRDGEEEEEEEAQDVIDDVTYRPSNIGIGDSTDAIFNGRMACLPVLDIFV